MAEKIQWRETELFPNGEETAEPVEHLEENFSEENYQPEDVVRIYIWTDGTYSMGTVIEKISAEVFGGEELNIQNKRPEDGILTANVPYGKIASIQKVGGVASVELVGKAEQTEQKRESEQEPAADLEQEEGVRSETSTEISPRGNALAEAQSSVLTVGIAGAAAVLLLMFILWAAVRNYRKRKGRRDET